MSIGQEHEKTQVERFRETARELECDGDPERFAERVRKVAKAAPAPQHSSKSKKPDQDGS